MEFINGMSLREKLNGGPLGVRRAGDIGFQVASGLQAAAALSHPNVCVIHEVGESGGQPFIAMQYVEGETLRDKARKGPLEPGEAVALAMEVAAGLSEAHGRGIIHRDIKSANIMVTPTGRAKVMDFGLAKRSGEISLTMSHRILGTVAYMSPEQA